MPQLTFPKANFEASVAYEVADKHIPSISYALVNREGRLAAGHIQRTGSSFEFNENTRFRIASLTKMFTAICVIQLAARGVVELDADVSAYLPNFTPTNPFSNTPVTLRGLLSHTARIICEPKTGLGALAISTLDSTNATANHLASDSLRMALAAQSKSKGRPPASRRKFSAPSTADITARVGHYSCRETGEMVEIAAQGPRLFLRGDGMPLQIKPDGKNRFAIDGRLFGEGAYYPHLKLVFQENSGLKWKGQVWQKRHPRWPHVFGAPIAYYVSRHITADLPCACSHKRKPFRFSQLYISPAKSPYPYATHRKMVGFLTARKSTKNNSCPLPHRSHTALSAQSLVYLSLVFPFYFAPAWRSKKGKASH